MEMLHIACMVYMWSKCKERRGARRREQKKKQRKEENNLRLTNKEVDSFLNVFLKTPSHSPLSSGFIKTVNSQIRQDFQMRIMTELRSSLCASYQLSDFHSLTVTHLHISHHIFSSPPQYISSFKTRVVLCSYILNFLPPRVTSSVGQRVWPNSFKSILICMPPFRKGAALLWMFPEERNICCSSRTHPLLQPSFTSHTEYFSISRNF